MQIVIDIPKEIYENALNNLLCSLPTLVNAIKNGKPLKTGHWIERPHEAGENWEYSMYECSECGALGDYYTDFCPNCGAKMEQEGS